VVLIDGAAHASNLTHPEQVNPPLLAFLRGL
jgi:pimeloyl-ACP methyl ester carboxylesterase